VNPLTFQVVIAPLAEASLTGGNVLMAVVGRTRSGKSYAAMRLGELVSEVTKTPFDENNVVFTPKDFFNVLNKRLPRGSILVFDEAGVGIPAKEWWSVSNRMVSTVAQTFGHMGYVVIFTMPHLGYIDKDVKHLFHYLVKTVRLRKREGKCRVRFLRLSVDPEKSNKIWKRRPVWFDGKGRHQVAFVDFTKPSEQLCLAYEKKAEKFKLGVLRYAEIAVDDVLRRTRGLHVDVNAIVDRVKAAGGKYYYSYQGRRVVNQAAIERDFNVGARVGQRVKRLVEGK